MKQVIILGTSGHSKVVTDIFRASSEYEILGYLSSDISIKEFEFLPILGTEEDYFSNHSIRDDVYFFIAIGDNYIRSKVASKLKVLYPSIQFATAIHPSAVISPSAVIGDGTAVMAQVAVNAHSRIGTHCILNTSCSIDHDTILSDFASAAPGVHTGGNVSIGTCSAVSIGSIVLHQVKIDDHTVVGAGTVVTKNIPAYSIAYGSPCKVIRSRKEGEKYL
jgi:sugar O-acyltransferase (sialic acid O-acetyltransferase NeuD family)